jgi:transcriptional regulator with XRE-family HTH domain
MDEMVAGEDVLLRFGKRVRVLRRAKGLSQLDLAAACNLNRAYISEVETGKRNISLRNIRAIADAVGVSLEKLFEGLD